jgi:hypothetical protein
MTIIPIYIHTRGTFTLEYHIAYKGFYATAPTRLEVLQDLFGQLKNT